MPIFSRKAFCKSNDTLQIPLNLQQRIYEKEQLDNLNLSGKILHQTLRELTTINRYFGNYRAMKKAVLSFINSQKKKTFHLIDIGCGGGDMLLMLAIFFQKNSIKATFLGLDGNAHSLAFAAQHTVGFSQITFQQADLLDPNFKLPECDILISSHFLYHFNNQQVANFLNQHKTQIHLGFIASELERTVLAFWLFKLGSSFLNFSQLTQQDGLLAIQRAFSKKELTNVIKNAGFLNFSVERRSMFRLLLTIEFSTSKTS